MMGVHSLFLFDAVDMQTSDLHLSQIISDNVRIPGRTSRKTLAAPWRWPNG
jgi:hypothetical protein